MTDNEAARSFAQQRRREASREEWREQTRLAEFLDELIDPTTTFWTSLENKPLSMLSGIFQKKRGVRSGIPDVLVFFRDAAGNVRIVFVELKSRSGAVSKVQRETRLAMLAAGAVWYMARSAVAALQALHLAGVVFRRPWRQPTLQPWEGPFADPHHLPQAPDVAERRRIARQQWRLRQRARREAERAALAAATPAGVILKAAEQSRRAVERAAASSMPAAERARREVERARRRAELADAVLRRIAPKAARAERHAADVAIARAERKAASLRRVSQRSALAGAARRARLAQREAELIARAQRTATLATPADAAPGVAQQQAS
jgi:hypothetical protein